MTVAGSEGFRHRIVQAGDVCIHAVTGGERGEPVVLIHGFPQTCWEWRSVMPVLAERHRVVALDLRGAGHSDCPQTGYDKATLAGDIHGVMTALGHERYTVCGHDIGAMVAVALAFTRRDAVSRLAVLDAPLPGWTGWKANLADPAVWHFAFHQKRDLPERLIQGRERDYLATFLSDRAFNHGAFPDEAVDLYTRAYALPGRMRGALEWYRAFAVDHAGARRWKQGPLSIHVLALGGEHRYGERIVSMLRKLATDVTGGGVADSGHWIPEEQPAALADALLAFLGDG